MQPDLEFGRPFVDTQMQFANQQKVLSAEQVHTLQVIKQGDKNQGFYKIDQAENLGGTTEALSSQFQIHSPRWKPSTTMWRLALIIGDSIVLIVMLLRIMNPPPHLGPN